MNTPQPAAGCDVWLSLIFMVLVAATFIGLGLAFASKMKDMSDFSLIMNFLIFPLFFLSGALFPLDRLPWAVKLLAFINPLTYGVDGLRFSLIGSSTFSPVIDLVVLAVSCTAFLTLGAYLFETSEVKWPYLYKWLLAELCGWGLIENPDKNHSLLLRIFAVSPRIFDHHEGTKTQELSGTYSATQNSEVPKK